MVPVTVGDVAGNCVSFPVLPGDPCDIRRVTVTVARVRVGVRIVVVAAVCVVWLPVLWFLFFEGFGDEPTRAVELARTQPDGVWAREDMYLTDAVHRRSLGLQTGQLGPPIHRNSNRVRVLVVGDSFTVGTGLRDLDARWPHRLERALDAATEPGTFEVVAFAQGGASVFTYASWLAELADGGDLGRYGSNSYRSALTEPFDVVVVGYVFNDPVPSDFLDAVVTDSVHTRVRERFGPDAVRERLDPVSTSGLAETLDVDVLPNDKYVSAAIDTIASLASPAIPVFAPLPQHTFEDQLIDRVAPRFADAGFVMVDPVATRALIGDHDVTELMVTAVDAHPNTALLSAYATDVAAAVLESLDPAQVEVAMSSAQPARRPDVSSFLPLHLDVAGDLDGVVTVVSDPAQVVCEPLTHFAGEIVCDPAEFVLVDGGAGPPQWAPCAALGHPFAQFGVAAEAANEAPLEVTLVLAADEGDGLWVASVGYDRAGFEVVELVAPLSVRRPVVVDLTAERLSGFVVVDTTAGCEPVDGRAIEMPAFVLEVRHL